MTNIATGFKITTVWSFLINISQCHKSTDKADPIFENHEIESSTKHIDDTSKKPRMNISTAILATVGSLHNNYGVLVILNHHSLKKHHISCSHISDLMIIYHLSAKRATALIKTKKRRHMNLNTPENMYVCQRLILVGSKEIMILK